MQNPTHPGFVGVGDRYSCDQCVAYHAEQYQFPLLLPANQQAVALYQVLQTQIKVAGMGEVIGLDFAAVPAVLQLYDVPRHDWRDLFDKLRICDDEASTYRAKQAEVAKAKAKAEARAARM